MLQKFSEKAAAFEELLPKECFPGSPVDKKGSFPKMKKAKRSSLLPKYILLYALAVFVPFGVMISSLVQSNLALEDEILQSNQASVLLIQTALDGTFTELAGALDSMSGNPELAGFALSNDPAAASAELKKITDAHDCLLEVFLTAEEDERLYASSGDYTPLELSFLPFMTATSAEEWISLAYRADRLTYRSGGDSVLFLFAPLTGERHAVLVIRQSHIQKLLASASVTEHDSVLVLDSNMELLSLLATDISHNGVLALKDYMRENPGITEEGSTLLDDGSMLFASRSAVTGLCYARILPESVVYRT